MRHSLLRQDARPDHWRAVFVSGVPVAALGVGIPMGAAPAPARVTLAPSGGVPSDYLEGPMPVMSGAMRRALDHAGVDNVQYWPAHVAVQYEEDAPVATDYWVAIIVGAVACAEPGPGARASAAVDDANFDAEFGDEPSDGPAPEPPPVASPFRIDPARAGGFRLFRLAEDRRLVVVSERVAARLRAAGLRGIVLQAPEDYDGRPVSTAPPDDASGLGAGV